MEMHSDVIELLEMQSLDPSDYENHWDMYKDADSDGEINAIMEDYFCGNRDKLVAWVCSGYLEYLDMACSADSELDSKRLLVNAHELYLQYVAQNAVAYYFHN